jgi:hypothetical protein
MQYVNYEEAIVQHYGIELVGWTYDKFVNPSELSTAIEPMHKLLNAINNGDCKFIKLTKEGCQKRLEEYRAKVAAGEQMVRERKTHSDAGIKRKGKAKEVTNDSTDNEDASDVDDHHKCRLTTLKRRRVSETSSGNESG